MHETTRSQKPVLSAMQALTKLLISKHGDNLGLSGYLKSFKELRDMVKTQLGNRMFDHFAEQQADYKRLTTAIDKENYDKALSSMNSWVCFSSSIVTRESTVHCVES
jgi:hypothetical protein